MQVHTTDRFFARFTELGRKLAHPDRDGQLTLAALVRPDRAARAPHDRHRPLRALDRAQEGGAGRAAGHLLCQGVRGQQEAARYV